MRQGFLNKLPDRLDRLYCFTPVKEIQRVSNSLSERNWRLQLTLLYLNLSRLANNQANNLLISSIQHCGIILDALSCHLNRSGWISDLGGGLLLDTVQVVSVDYFFEL